MRWKIDRNLTAVTEDNPILEWRGEATCLSRGENGSRGFVLSHLLSGIPSP
jgi:hypothetical protein